MIQISNGSIMEPSKMPATKKESVRASKGTNNREIVKSKDLTLQKCQRFKALSYYPVYHIKNPSIITLKGLIVSLKISEKGRIHPHPLQ